MSANRTEETVEARVRRRLRELRAERGLTLQQVATRASLDVSTLSRLETGKRRLALDHVPALAAALGVSSDDLLGSGPPQDPRVRSEPIRRHGLVMWPLTHRDAGSGLRAYRVEIGAERDTPPDPLPVHEGHDWIYVLHGRMRLVLGDHEHVIEPGEAAEFSTWTPHWFGALDGPVDVLLIVGAQGERAHLQS
jgi:transcriptional regulator with XRE-family HTH domain